jgi:hypothetical protein
VKGPAGGGSIGGLRFGATGTTQSALEEGSLVNVQTRPFPILPLVVSFLLLLPPVAARAVEPAKPTSFKPRFDRCTLT